MTWLITQIPETATGTPAETYGAITKPFGRVLSPTPCGFIPAALIFSPSNGIALVIDVITPALSAAVPMSKNHDCEYCVGSSEALLINMCGQTPDEIAVTKAAPLAEKDRAMPLFVLRSHGLAARGDQAPSRLPARAWWTDGDMLDAVAHGARNTAADIPFSTFKIG